MLSTRFVLQFVLRSFENCSLKILDVSGDPGWPKVWQLYTLLTTPRYTYAMARISACYRKARMRKLGVSNIAGVTQVAVATGVTQLANALLVEQKGSCSVGHMST